MTKHRPPRTLFAEGGRWLFGPAEDLLLFGGSALASAVLLAVGALTGVLDREAPEWVFVLCVLSVDVAHVWATGFRVYFDAQEVARRPLLYLGVPALSFLLALMAQAMSPLFFWRALAYVAVFHFVRQQAGWVALYGRRDQHAHPLERWLDKCVIYAVTLHPLIVWHTRLPEPFAWFVQGDFAPGLPVEIANASAMAMWFAIAAYAAKELFAIYVGRFVPGRALVVTSTFACWFGGIVVLRSDFAFTVTNVLIHGIPYLYLSARYARRSSANPRALATRIAELGIPAVVFTTILLAFCEEAVWDRLIFQDHTTLFGEGRRVGRAVELWLVPLLALPQITHYVLDAFVWRVRADNPVLSRELEGA